MCMKWWKNINYKELKKELKKEYKEQQEENKKSLYEEALEKCKNNEEMWVKIKDYEDYELSNLGNCRRKKKDGTYKSVGYYDKTEDRIKLQLHNENGIKATTLASMMSKVFEIPNPKNRKMVVCIDGNTMNCRLDNLICCHNKEFKRDNKKNEINDEYNDKDKIDKELAKHKMSYNTETEIWKDVVGYERWYEVSNLGNVRRIERDGTTTLLKATFNDRPRGVGLRTTGKTTTYNVMKLVCQAFNIKPTKDNDKFIYHIDGDISNDRASNLTYDITLTEEYIKEQERLKAEQEEQERLEQEKNNQKQELFEYIENNKEFLNQTKEMNKEITLKDIYDKLNELIEVIKNGNR